MKRKSFGLIVLLAVAVGCSNSQTSQSDVDSAAKELASKGANTPSAPPMQVYNGGGTGAGSPGVAAKPHRN